MTLLVTSHGRIQCYFAMSADAFWLLFLHCNVYDTYTSKVIDYVNILKINVRLKHLFSAHFQKILHRFPLCTLIILAFTTYTQCNHMMITFKCKTCQEIICHVIENVAKTYVNVTCAIQKKHGTTVM